MTPYYPDLSNASWEELLVRLEEVRRINALLQEQIVAERQRTLEMATRLHEIEKAAK